MSFAKKILPLVITTVLFGTAYADETNPQPADQTSAASSAAMAAPVAGAAVTKHVKFSNVKSQGSEASQQDCDNALKEGDVTMKDHIADNSPEDFKLSDNLTIKGFKIDNLAQETADANGVVHRVWVGEAHLTTKDGEKIADFKGEADVKKDGSQTDTKGRITISKIVNGSPVQICTADFESAAKS